MLIGIDPDYVETKEIMGATFQIRPVPSGKWDRLRKQGIEAYRRAVTRAIAQLAADGLNPDEINFTHANGKEYTRTQVLAAEDPLYLEELISVELESVRWSVIGHSGITTREGKEILFQSETVRLDTEPYEAVSKETLRFYRANRRLLSKLHDAIFRVSDLAPEEKKD